MDIEYKDFFSKKPQLVVDLLNIHFFKPYAYHSYFMEHGVKHLSMSRELVMCIELLKEVQSYTKDFGRYELIYHKNFFGSPQVLYFPLFFDTLIRYCYNSCDLEDMVKRMYLSKEGILVGVAEQLKNEKIEILNELFNFLKREECNVNKEWEMSDIENNTYNETLLALNSKVYNSILGDDVLEEIFEDKIEKIKTIEKKSKFTTNYQGMMDWIFDLIVEKFE